MSAIILTCLIYVSSAVPALGYSVRMNTDVSNYAFFPVTSNVMNIGVETKGCVDILLSQSPSTTPSNYRITLGCSENYNKYYVRVAKNNNIQMEKVVRANFLNKDQLNNFTICWSEVGDVAVGKAGMWYPLILWTDIDSASSYVKILYFGIRSRKSSSEYGHNRYNEVDTYDSYPGSWVIEAGAQINFTEAFATKFQQSIVRISNPSNFGNMTTSRGTEYDRPTMALMVNGDEYSTSTQVPLGYPWFGRA